MKKAIKWILVLLLFALLMLVGAFAFINNPIVKQPLVNKISESLGRPLHLNGAIHITWGDPWQFSLNDVVIDNAAWGSSPHALKVEKFRVNIDTSLLFSGKLAIEQISLIKPQIWLENKNGQSNWQFKEQTNTSDSNNGESSEGRYPQWLLLEHINIRNGQLYFYQRGKPQQLSIRSVDFKQNSQQASLNAVFAMHDKTFSLSSKTLALPLLLNADTKGEFEVLVGRDDSEDRVELNGQLQLSESKVDINAYINLSVDDLSAYSDIFDTTLPVIKDIEGKARVDNLPDNQDVFRLSDINVSSVSRGLNMSLSGKLDNIIKAQGVDIDIEINGQTNVQSLIPDLNNDFNLQTDIKANLFSKNNDILLDINAASVNSDIASVTVGQNTISLKQNWDKPLPINVRIPDSAELANTFDIDLPTLKDVELNAAILRHQESLEISRFDISSRDNHIVVNSSGNLFYKDEKWQGAEDLEITLDAFVLNSWLEGLSDTGLVQLTLNTELTGQGDTLSFENLEIRSNTPIDADKAILTANGRWQDISNIATLDVDAQIALNSLAELSTISQIQLPDQGPLLLNATVRGDRKDKLHIKDMRLELNNAAADIEITGQYENVLSENRILQLNTNSELRDAAVFQVFLQSDNQTADKDDLKQKLNMVSLFMPAAVKTDLRFAQGNLSMQNINIQSDAYGLSTSINGSIDSSKPWKGNIDLISQGQLDIDAIEKSIEIENMPKIIDGQINLNAKIIANDNLWGLTDLQLSVDSQNGQISAKGSVPSFKPLASEDFLLTLKSNDLHNIIVQDLGTIDGQAVDIKVHVHGSQNPTEAQLMDFNASVGSSDINGKIGWQSLDSSYEITANLLSRRIDLDSLLRKETRAKDKAPRKALFTNSPFSLDWMSRFNIDFNWQVKRLIGAILTLQDVNAKSKLSNNKMQNQVQARTEKGALDANFDLEKIGQALAMHLNLDGNNIETAAITQLGLEEVIDNSALNFRVNLAGEGDSSQQLMSSLDGVIELQLDEAELKNSLLDWVGGDIISGLVGAINPIKKREENINLECASVYVNVNDGRIDEKDFIGLKTDKVTMLGDAKINLADESMELYFVPRANKGLGISASTVAKMVRIGGTFTQPKIETDAEGLLKSGAAVGLAVASGGWSLVAQGLFDRFESSQDICQRVFENNANNEPVTKYKREVVKQVGDKSLIRVQVPDVSAKEQSDQASQSDAQTQSDKAIWKPAQLQQDDSINDANPANDR